MKILIAVFSPTGNGKFLSGLTEQALFTHLNNVSTKQADKEQISLLDLTNKRQREDLAKDKAFSLHCDIFVLVYPVYSHSIPDVLCEYLESVQINADNAILIASYGGVGYGNALYDAAQIMNAKGVNIIGAAAIQQKHSYLSYSKTTELAKTDIDLNEAVQYFMQECLNNKREQKSVFPKKHFAAGKIFGQKIMSSFTLKVPYLDVFKCSGCGQCIEVCPVGAIGEDLVLDDTLCIRCCACVEHCDIGARKKMFTNSLSKAFIERNSNRKRQIHYIL